MGTTVSRTHEPSVEQAVLRPRHLAGPGDPAWVTIAALPLTRTAL